MLNEETKTCVSDAARNNGDEAVGAYEMAGWAF